MIYQPFRAHSLLDIAEAAGMSPAFVREAARRSPGSGFGFDENHVRPAHTEFVTGEFVEALVGAVEAGSVRDRVFGTMTPLCVAEDKAARAVFNARVENDRFNQPVPAAPETYEIGAWVPSHRSRLGV